jgi:hypothetical protein
LHRGLVDLHRGIAGLHRGLVDLHRGIVDLQRGTVAPWERHHPLDGFLLKADTCPKF